MRLLSGLCCRVAGRLLLRPVGDGVTLGGRAPGKCKGAGVVVVAGRVELEEALAMVIGMGRVVRSQVEMLGDVLLKDSALAL